MAEVPPDFLEPFDRELMMRVGAYEIITTARLEGLRIAVTDDDTLYFWGSPALRERWRPYLVAKRAEVIKELRYGICDRCGERGSPLVPSWWGEHEQQFCEDCATTMTTDLGVGDLDGGER